MGIEAKIKNTILKDNINKQNNPLALVGNHYEFVLINNINGRQEEVEYPTQNRIGVISIEKDKFGDLKFFENKKYHSLLFSYDGKFKQEPSYNSYSKSDKVFAEEVYRYTVDHFTLKKII